MLGISNKILAGLVHKLIGMGQLDVVGDLNGAVIYPSTIKKLT